jgi:hypothetical protein
MMELDELILLAAASLFRESDGADRYAVAVPKARRLWKEVHAFEKAQPIPEVTK